jgi:hypothetical protein
MTRSCFRFFSALGRINKVLMEMLSLSWHAGDADSPVRASRCYPNEEVTHEEGRRSKFLRQGRTGPDCGACTAPFALYPSEIVFSDLSHRRYVSARRKQYSKFVPKQLDYCGRLKFSIQGENACLTRNARPRRQCKRYEAGPASWRKHQHVRSLFLQLRNPLISWI